MPNPPGPQPDGHLSHPSWLDPPGLQLHPHGLPDHLVVVTAGHPVCPSRHMAVVAPRLDSPLGAVLEKLLEAGLLQRPVESIGQVDVLEGELVAPGAELGLPQRRVVPHRVLGDPLLSDVGGNHHPVANMATQAVHATRKPLGLLPVRLVQTWWFGGRQSREGDPRRVAVQAVLLPIPLLQALDFEVVSRCGHVVTAALPLLEFLLVARPAPGVSPADWCIGDDRVEPLVEQDRRMSLGRCQHTAHLPPGQAEAGNQQDNNSWDNL